MEANWARVSQSDLKTGRGAVQMAHMTSSRRSRVDEAKDGGAMRWATSDYSTPTLSFLLY
jgi:hypothetical protein